MQIISTAIPDLLIIEPTVFRDERGFFFESFNQTAFNLATGLELNFIQDNHSRSNKGVLRGLHYQTHPHSQGKLVRVTKGAVWDVAVDMRKNSATFGLSVGIELSESNHRQFWIPSGFAHGFVVISEGADFLYKTTEYYTPRCEICILWNDPILAIQWPLIENAIVDPLISKKDQSGLSFQEAPVFE